VVKLIASSVRKGNVLELDGKLYVVMTSESTFPGKGTPTTQMEMRRISDGVKVTQRYRTTEQVERAFVDEATHNYLYEEPNGFVFMNPKNYEQITVSKEILGDGAAYLSENMEVSLSTFNGVPIAIELPAKVTLEVVETEPALKGQTASSSFKPAKLSNGVRTMVPHHIVPGSMIVVSTEDGSYVERAKN
jgi:elongation factor P